MDISASVSNLRFEEESKQDAQIKEIIASCTSLSQYESKRFKTLLPQILATLIAASFHIVVGITLAFSAVLIPQLRNTTILSSNINSSSNATDSLQEQKEAWVASITVLIVPVLSVLVGVLMDWFGRLNTLKLATIPVVLGWILIATAQNFPMILLGRILTGAIGAIGTNPAIVYITEIARPDMRGSLISSGPAFASLGMVVAYLKGWFMEWRTISWLCNIWTIIPCILLFFIPESPAWYVSKGKFQEAKKSLEWIHKYQPQPMNKKQTVAELHLEVLIKEHEKKQLEQKASKDTGVMIKLKEFAKPSAIKPLFILMFLFVFQQFSGIYITLFYAIDFFKQMGSTINPYLASIFVGTVRFGMSMANTYLLKRFERRPLVMVSCVGMAICMFVSGLFSKWIIEGTTTMTWIPIVCLLLYVITSMIGLLPIPWTMTAEVFPLEIRGVAQSLSHGLANIIMFLAIQSYPSLSNLLGGIVYSQWFFTVVSLLGMVYTFVFLPETHGKKLNDIVEYFVHNTLYITSRTKKRNDLEKPPDRKPIIKNSRMTTKDFEKCGNDQNKHLIEKV